jgi:hypothetical protein
VVGAERGRQCRRTPHPERVAVHIGEGSHRWGPSAGAARPQTRRGFPRQLAYSGMRGACKRELCSACPTASKRRRHRRGRGAAQAPVPRSYLSIVPIPRRYVFS